MPSRFVPRSRKVRILATLGPASDTPEMIRRLSQAGADAFRINMSHGSHEDHARRIAAVRALESELERPTTIVADLQGPKLRVGRFKGDKAESKTGQRFVFDRDDKLGDVDPGRPAPPRDFRGGRARHAAARRRRQARLPRRRGRSPSGSRPRSRSAARISNNKGLNVPDVVLPLAALTEKDRADLAFALEQHVDWIALSFVQRPEDVAEARRLIGGKANLLAKIEKPAAIDRLEDILELADAVMVARGDLGVEMPPEDGAAAAEADRRGGAADGPAGGGRDADARIDDLLALADPGRSLRRRHRGL